MKEYNSQLETFTNVRFEEDLMSCQGMFGIEVYTPIPGVWSGSIPAKTAGLVPLQTPLVGTGTNPTVPTGTGLLTKQQSTCK